ncbi:iron ABC transporter [Clostridiales bacterium PH28_bin88]|nr:iron ABC transporter [Clostridiales bacterium PH28_bin88]
MLKSLEGWQAKLMVSLPALALLWAVVVIGSAVIGSANISPLTAAGILVHKVPVLGPALVIPDWTRTMEVIIWKIRFPRILMGSLVGAGLAVAGAAFQGLLRNPLADPYTVGVSSGAAVGAVLVMLAGAGIKGVPGIGLVPVGAFLGAILTIITVYRLARIGGRVAVETLILAGVVVGSFLTAILSFMLTRAYHNLEQVVFWLMGSLSLRSWGHVAWSLPALLAGMVIIGFLARELNLLALGEETAQHLGVGVERAKVLILFAASLVTAQAVAMAGTIGFVGLVTPHVVRMVLGPDHRVLLPVAALTGSIFLVLADTLARTVIAPAELPVGVITAFLGAPFFGYLLRTRQRSMWV